MQKIENISTLKRPLKKESIISFLKNKRKSLPTKYLYDDIGSKLFEEICDTEEYYLSCDISHEGYYLERGINNETNELSSIPNIPVECPFDKAIHPADVTTCVPCRSIHGDEKPYRRNRMHECTSCPPLDLLTLDPIDDDVARSDAFRIALSNFVVSSPRLLAASGYPESFNRYLCEE